MSRQPIVDAEARRQAILTDRHAFVWASAGTGKTHTLTLRALYLLLTPEDSALFSSPDRSERLRAARQSIRSQVLTTFTRKAAAEMQTRLFRYLDCIAGAPSLEALASSEIGGGDPMLPELLEKVAEAKTVGSFTRLRRGARALSELASELQISTLHSFGASILKRHPLAAEIPPGIRYAEEDEDDIRRFEDVVVDRWWSVQAFQRPDLQQELGKVLLALTPAEIATWLKSVYANPWILEEMKSWSPPQPDEIDRFVSAARPVVERLSGASGSKIQRSAAMLEEVCSLLGRSNGEAWAKLHQFSQEFRDYFFLEASKIPAAIRTALDSGGSETLFHFADASELTHLSGRGLLFEAFPEAWSAGISVLEKFRVWVEGAAVEDLGLVTFDDMIRLSTRLLNENEPIRSQERRRIRSLLVDEFQDTDPDQLRLLEALLRSDGSEHEVLGFFVGDEKQSIYRFRKADVWSIRRFSEEFIARTGARTGKDEFFLKTSFRSLPTITSFVNDLFSNYLPLADEREQLEPFRTGSGDPPVWAIVEAEEDDRKGSAQLAAAKLTADLIESRMKRDDQAKHSDFLILSRTNAELDVLLPVLTGAGIPVVAAGARTFYRHHEVLDTINLLISLLHPQDTLAVFSVLRSPIVHLSDPEIFQLTQRIHAGSLFFGQEPLPSFLHEAVGARIDIIRGLVGSRTELPLTEWIRRVEALIPKAAYVSRSDREGRSFARIQKVFRAFSRELADSVHPPVTWLLQQRERASTGDRWDSDMGEDVILADERIDAVRAMTLHKAKGLEGKTVILYCWSSLLEGAAGAASGPGGSSAVLSFTGPEGDRIEAFSQLWGGLKLETANYRRTCRIDQQAETEESLRHIYVAATRARNHLYLINPQWGRLQTPKSIQLILSGGSNGQSAGMTFEVQRVKNPQFTPRPLAEISISFSREEYQRLWNSRYSSTEAKSPLFRSPSDPLEDRDEVFDRDDFQPSPGLGLQVGRLVHAYLERYAREAALDETRLLRLARQIRTGSHREALDPARKVLKRFYSGEAADPAGRSCREILSRCKILGREVPILLRRDDASWSGIVDLILGDREQIVAVDYKTGKRPSPLPTHYRKQQEIYQDAVRRLFPESEVRFEFWWLSGGAE